MSKVIVSMPLAIDEDVHNEFRMHTKLQLTEVCYTISIDFS